MSQKKTRGFEVLKSCGMTRKREKRTKQTKTVICCLDNHNLDLQFLFAKHSSVSI